MDTDIGRKGWYLRLPWQRNSGGELPKNQSNTQETPMNILKLTEHMPRTRSWTPGPECHMGLGTQYTHKQRSCHVKWKGSSSVRAGEAETVGAMPLQDACSAGEGSEEKVQGLNPSVKEVNLAVGGRAHCSDQG